jgi:hypothetical protein
LISASSPTPRLTRLAILAVTGATALSVAACGSSNKAAPTSTSTSTSTVTSTTTSPAPASGEARVSGLIASVAGNSIQVTKEDPEDKGTAAVNFTSTTKVTEVTPATLTDVTTGSCVSVRPTKEESQGGQQVTAASVRVSPAVNGTCPPLKEAGPGSTSPAPSGSPTTAPAKGQPVRGAVASVAGNTITVTGSDASGNTKQTTVTVDDKTKYTKRASANSDAITAGKCLGARGTMDNAGTLQATTINLRPANDGKCGGKPPHGQGG